MITAMANGELEIGNLAYSTFALAVQNAKLDDLRVIADEFQDGVEGYYSNEFLVLKDSGIEKVGDLKGKVLATNSAGSAIDIAMRAMLRRHGLEDKRDYTVVETQFPAMRAMLEEKKVAMIQGTLPFSLDPELKKIARPLFTSKDAIGRSQFVFWTARKAFLEKNRAAVADFMEDALRIERWFFDPANHDEVMQIASRITKQPPERFSWAFTKADFYRDPNMLPDLGALQSNINTTRELGFVKIDIDVPKFADLSFAQEAAKRLK
jgi:sulfonate transport system substrate-binding protein